MDSTSLSEEREKLKRFYETSHEYKKLLDAHNREYLRAYVDLVNKYTRKASKVLDLGCGNGLSSYMLSEYGHWVVGTDISLFFLSDSSNLQSDKLKYQVCDALNLPLVENSFDVVCSTELIEHITDVPKALTEMIRVLKIGGILIIVGPNLCSPFWAFIDLLHMLKGREGRYVWAETKLQALKWGVGNFCLSLKKRLSSKVDFIYRKPDLEKACAGGDSDSTYYASPIDLEKFLKAHGMEIIKFCESFTLRGKIVANLLPRFSPYISMVARKK